FLWAVLFRHLSSEWSLNEQYSYGWFVPIFAAYLFWLRWEDRPEAARGQRSEVRGQKKAAEAKQTLNAQRSTLNAQLEEQRSEDRGQKRADRGQRMEESEA